MATTVYYLVPSFGGEYEDVEITLNLELALEWLKKYPKTRQIIEYSVSDSSITRSWCGFWYYDADGNLKHDLEESTK